MTGADIPPLPEGLGPVDSARPLSGGMVADVWSVELGGRRAVVKRTSYDARLEAEGLEVLADAGALVPEVLGVNEQILVLEAVSGTGDWHDTGRRLAAVHRNLGERFGWQRDNVIGPLHQDNRGSDDWPTFYAERRVRPHLGHAALPADVRDRLAVALDGPLQERVAHDTRPSLVHGDLWSGNVIDGTYLIDPAVHHADRELDLAFADLFGGIPREFWDAYHAAWPLDAGWEDRRPALQLYHLLVHVALFGASYAASVRRRLDQLGW